MSEEPKVVRQWAQSVTGAGVPSALPKPQEIAFFGHKGKEHKTFSVLAGEGAPTLTGGWVKIANVQRFQRVSLTIPEGFDPLLLSVPILFNAVVQQGEEERAPIETNIQKLEWMAGRPAHPKSEITGEPPYVEVYSVNGTGQQTNLVPRQFQTVPGISQQWYITGIAFDTNPLRDRGAERLRQAATVELTEVVLSPSALSRARKEREAVKGKFETFKTTNTVDTIRRVAADKSEPGAWKAILEANKNLGSNADKPLELGTKVKIPLVIYQQAPR